MAVLHNLQKLMRRAAIFSASLHEINYLRLCLWSGLLFLIMGDATLVYWLNLSINWRDLHPQGLTIAAVTVLGLTYVSPYVERRYGRILSSIYQGMLHYVEAICLFTMFTTALSTLMYVLVIWSGATPFYDAGLLYIDQLLSWNWIGYVAWVSNHPTIYTAYYCSYASFLVQPAVIVTALFICQQYLVLYRFVIAFMLGLLFAVALAGLFPSEGFIAFTHFDVKIFPHVYMEPGYMHLEQLHQFRSGQLRVLFDQPLRGLVTFPSVHALAAVIFTWGVWRVPYLCWMSLLINGLLIASTPVIGAHYLIDGIAGVALGLFSIWLSGLILKYRPQPVIPRSAA